MFGILKSIGQTAMLGNTFNHFFARIDYLQNLEERSNPRAKDLLVCLIFYAQKEIHDVFEASSTSELKSKSMLSTKLRVPHLSSSNTYTAFHLWTMAISATSGFLQRYNDERLFSVAEDIGKKGRYYQFLEATLPRKIKDFHPDNHVPAIRNL